MTALDAMGYSALFARATLGINRNMGGFAIDGLLKVVEDATADEDWSVAWHDAAAAEKAAIAAGDSDALLECVSRFPQIWRAGSASAAQGEQFKVLAAQAGTAQEPLAGVVTTHYAGTYFGVRQALAIDTLRRAIARLGATRSISDWEESVLLAALLSAASDAAFSAGKHFAQVHRVRPGKDLSFLRRRILKDRGIEIRVLFNVRARELFELARGADEGHEVIEASLDDVTAHSFGPIDVVYADPPYTAQQYSRFYHVLDVIHKNRVPVLQVVQGRVTRGLYPDGKFLSRFCSKRAAPQAFQDLFSLTDSLKAHLVLSYSASRSGVSGNDRMITLDQLLDAARSTWPRREIRVEELGHDYRQFNHGGSAVQGRADAEVLVIARA